ncbi:hypothetical protein DPMN_148880 [Dreissena polymorpha]|uniref:Uncharacterized protein n=1 Tax=Dreissena polymorpha TaxID=45954 RepID=A0A9D4FEX0_DREPO|nr:hypothetical protein DPMN_148880 [Dreissena polymorpha]
MGQLFDYSCVCCLPRGFHQVHILHLLDSKYIQIICRNLTQRQSRLMDRRKNAEELLKWKKILDAEEARVYKLEKKALKGKQIKI